MINTIIEMLQYTFIQRAILVGTLVSLCAALLGVSLVLKRYAMIGDGLSHVGFGILAVALAIGWSPLLVSIPVVIIVAILLLKIGNNSKIQSDSAIGIIASSSLAIGVAVTSATTGINTDVWNYMFGSILAMSESDVILSVIVSIIVGILFLIYYRKLFAVTFDENFAKASGLMSVCLSPPPLSLCLPHSLLSFFFSHSPSLPPSPSPFSLLLSPFSLSLPS